MTWGEAGGAASADLIRRTPNDLAPSGAFSLTDVTPNALQWFNCPQAFSNRLMLTGWGVRSSCAKKLTRSSSSN
jgi:hypothetical protein